MPDKRWSFQVVLIIDHKLRNTNNQFTTDDWFF